MLRHRTTSSVRVPHARARSVRPNRRRRLAISAAIPVVVLVAASFAGPASIAAPARATHSTVGRTAPYVQHQMLVRFRSGVDAAAIAQLNARLGASTVKRFSFVPGLQLLQLKPALSVTKTVAAFSSQTQVLYAQPNWVSHIGPTTRGNSEAAPASIGKTPNDPRYGEQWDWPKVNAPKAWDLSTGSHTVVVGDIDTGLEYTHEDLAANAWQNTAECNGKKGKDDDGNGYVDDCYGIDTINGDTNPIDDNGHGTHTGGTIGAVGNNGIGVTGFSWSVQVLPCKSHDSSGNGSVASIIECYQYMVTEKAAGNDIIATNNSYGGCPEACDYDQATKDGIAAMGKAGILFAVAAANNSSDNDVKPVYPSNYFLPNVLPVAATTSTDGLASFSDYGVRTVMVGAPGQGILSTYRNNAYGNLSGTSMATPHVAGLAGLLHAYDPSLSIYQIRNLIIAGGDSITSLAGKTVSGKRIDAFGSLKCKNSTAFGLLRPLETVSLADGTQTIAALNINCAKAAGGLSVTIKPGNVKLTLADKGKDVDLQKKDGIYSVAWTPAGAGTYTLKFSNGQSYVVTVTAAEAPVRS